MLITCLSYAFIEWVLQEHRAYLEGTDATRKMRENAQTAYSHIKGFLTFMMLGWEKNDWWTWKFLFQITRLRR